MKLAIFGSRHVFGAKVVKAIKKEIENNEAEYILTAAEPMGVCKIARELAKDVGKPLILYYLNKSKNAGMYHHRSVAVLKDCDKCLFIWDGESKGTKNEIDVCIKLDKPYQIILQDTLT